MIAKKLLSEAAILKMIEKAKGDKLLALAEMLEANISITNSLKLLDAVATRAGEPLELSVREAMESFRNSFRRHKPITKIKNGVAYSTREVGGEKIRTAVGFTRDLKILEVIINKSRGGLRKMRIPQKHINIAHKISAQERAYRVRGYKKRTIDILKNDYGITVKSIQSLTKYYLGIPAKY